MVPINLTAAQTIIYNDNFIIEIDIRDAYYLDADEGFIANDILTQFEIEIYKNGFNIRKSMSFYLLISLILPSGDSYSYLFYVVAPSTYSSNSEVYFYNHATESGWYQVKVTGILLSGDYSNRIGTESFNFDPPGGTDGTEPLGCRLTI